MQIGLVTMDGRQVGVVSWTEGEAADPFVPDLGGYEPLGRAEENHFDGAPQHHGHGTYAHQAPRHREERPPQRKGRYGGEGDLDQRPEQKGYSPRGEQYHGDVGRPVHQGSAEVDQAIRDAAAAHHLDVNTLRSIASIESSMNPASNANRKTQYKGLFQIGTRGKGSEWSRFGEGNVYNAHDNAMAAARMFEANRGQFRSRYGRDPTDTELYMMHQQGLGFYTRGAMTNIGGNPYPGMRGPQSHESFEAGWGREVARRKAQFAGRQSAQAEPKPADVTFDPETMAP